MAATTYTNPQTGRTATVEAQITATTGRPGARKDTDDRLCGGKGRREGYRIEWDADPAAATQPRRGRWMAYRKTKREAVALAQQKIGLVA